MPFLHVHPVDEHIVAEVHELMDDGWAVVHPQAEGLQPDEVERGVERALAVREGHREVAVRAKVVDAPQDARHEPVAVRVGRHQLPDLLGPREDRAPNGRLLVGLKDDLAAEG